jgi:hypothetical protein
MQLKNLTFGNCVLSNGIAAGSSDTSGNCYALRVVVENGLEWIYAMESPHADHNIKLCFIGLNHRMHIQSVNLMLIVVILCAAYYGLLDKVVRYLIVIYNC